MATQEDTTHPSDDTLLATRRLIAWGLLWGSLMMGLMLIWLSNKDLDLPVLTLAPLLLLAVAGLVGSLRLLRQPAPADTTAAQFHAAILNQQRLTGRGLLVAAGLLLLLALLLIAQEGLGGFAEVCGLVFLAAISAGTAAGQLVSQAGASSRERLLEGLGKVLSTFLTGLVPIGIALGLFAWRSLRRGGVEVSPEMVGLLVFGVVCEAAFLFLKPGASGRTRDQDLRLQVLVVGGSLGLLIALVMLWRIWLWWGDIFPATEALAQSPGLWRLWLCFYVELLGLGLLFGSLLLARADIRQNIMMRRLLYGYNAVLSSFLVLVILFVANVVVAVAYPINFSWSRTQGLHSLADSSKNLLNSLKDQVEIYVLMSPGAEFYPEVRSLLENIQGYAPKVQVDYVSPDKEGTRYKRLVDKYPAVMRDLRVVSQDQEDVGRGILLVYGPDVGATARPHAFIGQGELGGRDLESHKPRSLFKGEDILMTQLRILNDREIKPKIYFTQGNGELNILLMPEFRERDALGLREGAGEVRERLKKDNYDVRGLRWRPPPEEKSPGLDIMAFAQKTAKDPLEVPEDARIVIMAAPIELRPEVVAALERYMNRKDSKLIILSNYVLHRQLPPMETGLEGFLKKFNVQLGMDFVLRHPPDLLRQDPLMVVAQPPTETRNKVAASFRNTPFILGGYLGPNPRDGIGLVRSVEPIPSPGGFEAVPLMEVAEDRRNGPVWAETDLEVLREPFRYLQRLEDKGLLDAKKSRKPVSVAVAVTDRDRKPRLVIFGDARFASNRFVHTPIPYYDFLTSSIEWLAERPGNIGIKPRESNFFVLQPEKVNKDRLIWLPLALVLMALVGLGAGIWIVRRR
ncbi:MAG TPA: Gldg family protein [Gemmataceae bacterium]|nr:Gldg family protein [Gemmataceae bacterium]